MANANANPSRAGLERLVIRLLRYLRLNTPSPSDKVAQGFASVAVKHQLLRVASQWTQSLLLL